MNRLIIKAASAADGWKEVEGRFSVASAARGCVDVQLTCGTFAECVDYVTAAVEEAGAEMSGIDEVLVIGAPCDVRTTALLSTCHLCEVNLRSVAQGVLS